MCHILMDRDNTCLHFLFVSHPSSNIVDAKYRERIFEMINANKIHDQIDTLHGFWD